MDPKQLFSAAWREMRAGRWRYWTDLHFLARKCWVARAGVECQPFLLRTVLYAGHAPHVLRDQSTRSLIIKQRDEAEKLEFLGSAFVCNKIPFVDRAES